MTKLILASKSPRRQQLMKSLGYPFEIEVQDTNEEINTHSSLRKEVEILSYRKAKAVYKNHTDAIVIGADTLVTINHEVLGKPANEEVAKEMLKKLSGNVHEVITGVTILYPDGSEESFSSVSKVTFDIMSDEEIDEYVITKEPMDKAGAYAIQGIGAKFIKKIEGDYYAIMGLPIHSIYKRIKKYF
ncbi:MAG: Maf family protein [Erysipelotrichaceae bacterium]|nr:Maf family protein [Erysipelotrichaceae bacterium]